MGCNVYDADLLTSGSQSIARSDVASAPQAGAPPGSAIGGGNEISSLPSSYPGEDAGTTQTCGDGLVAGRERCDTAIVAGEAGACPTSCPPSPDCLPRVLSGSACQASCVLAEGELGCKAGDGCCPGSCTHSSDSDCSARCGDGIVQPESGETCEFQSSVPCKTTLAECDDDDACTVDALKGSMEHCDADCVHTRIGELAAGDGCCQTGANANTDSDCKPVCGNRVVEPGEKCDGGDDCDSTCQIAASREQLSCLKDASNECQRCACQHCTGTELACRSNDDAKLRQVCSDIIDCSQAHSCTDSTQCYCGALLCLLPPIDGDCKAVIDAASGDTTFDAAMRQANDSSSAIARALAADDCRVDQCKGVCR